MSISFSDFAPTKTDKSDSFLSYHPQRVTLLQVEQWRETGKLPGFFNGEQLGILSQREDFPISLRDDLAALATEVAYLDSLSQSELTAMIASESAKEIYHNAFQLAFKLTLNSIYGSFLNRFFACYNKDIGAAITNQGRHLTEYVMARWTKYFHRIWHKDAALHEKMGLAGIEQVGYQMENETEDIFANVKMNYDTTSSSGTEKKRRSRKDIAVYADTDSCFITLEPALASAHIPEEEARNFILQLNEHLLAPTNRQFMNDYADDFGVENLHDFEIEKIAYNGIWLGKKNYLLDLAWEEGNVYYDSGKSMLVKGIDLVKSSTPTFVRQHLYDVVKWILTSPRRREIQDLTEMLRKLRGHSQSAHPQDVAKNSACNNYESYVLNDQNEIKLAPKCPPQVQGAAHYNYILHNSPEEKKKYPRIKSGDRVKWYYVKNPTSPETKIFAFLRGQYPYEFAPEMDEKMQFFKTVVVLVNRFTKVLRMDELRPDLTYMESFLAGIMKK